MVHRCMIKTVVIWLHILVAALLMCVCRTVREQTYHCVTIAYNIQYSNVLYRFVA